MIRLTVQRGVTAGRNCNDPGVRAASKRKGEGAMRIWMLALLLFAVTATGGNRGMKTSSRFFNRVVLRQYARYREQVFSFETVGHQSRNARCPRLP